MIRIVIDVGVDSTNESAANRCVNRFLSEVSELGTTTVSRSDVVAPIDADQAEADMVEAFRGDAGGITRIT